MGKISGALDTRYKEVTDTGVKQRYIEGYHPSVIEDPAGFAKEFNKIMDEQVALGKKDKAILSSIEKTKAEVRNLTDEVQNGTLAFEEYSKQIEKLLNKDVIRKITDPKSQFSKERTMRTVPDRLQKYYKDPHAAMADYFTETAKVIAERKYLGKGYENVAEGIGNRLASELAAGRINEAQFVEWKKILEERFRPQTGGSKFLQKVKNAGYMATIANPLSASVQVLDIIPAAMRYGVRNTVKSIARTLTPGANKITPQKIGLYETAHDLVNDPRAKLLNASLKTSTFKIGDRFGKTVLLNASRNWAKELASKDSGIKKLEKRGWRHIYDTPDAWEGFLNALKKGDYDNPIVQEVAIAELLNTQPIAMSHMPISYLRSPNGRIWYMLKTWALRQVNQVREAAAKGDKYLAVKLVGGLVLSNYSSPHLRGMIAELFGAKPTEHGEVSDQLVGALARTVFLDPYALSKGVQTGKATTLMAQFFGTPIADAIMSTFSDIVNVIENEGDLPLEESKSLRYVPLVGSILNKVVKE